MMQAEDERDQSGGGGGDRAEDMGSRGSGMRGGSEEGVKRSRLVEGTLHMARLITHTPQRSPPASDQHAAGGGGGGGGGSGGAEGNDDADVGEWRGGESGGAVDEHLRKHRPQHTGGGSHHHRGRAHTHHHTTKAPPPPPMAPPPRTLSDDACHSGESHSGNLFHSCVSDEGMHHPRASAGVELISQEDQPPPSHHTPQAATNTTPPRRRLRDRLFPGLLGTPPSSFSHPSPPPPPPPSSSSSKPHEEGEVVHEETGPGTELASTVTGSDVSQPPPPPTDQDPHPDGGEEIKDPSSAQQPSSTPTPEDESPPSNPDGVRNLMSDVVMVPSRHLAAFNRRLRRGLAVATPRTPTTPPDTPPHSPQAGGGGGSGGGNILPFGQGRTRRFLKSVLTGGDGARATPPTTQTSRKRSSTFGGLWRGGGGGGGDMPRASEEDDRMMMMDRNTFLEESRMSMGGDNADEAQTRLIGEALNMYTDATAELNSEKMKADVATMREGQRLKFIEDRIQFIEIETAAFNREMVALTQAQRRLRDMLENPENAPSPHITAEPYPEDASASPLFKSHSSATIKLPGTATQPRSKAAAVDDSTTTDLPAASDEPSLDEGVPHTPPPALPVVVEDVELIDVPDERGRAELPQGVASSEEDAVDQTGGNHESGGEEAGRLSSLLQGSYDERVSEVDDDGTGSEAAEDGGSSDKPDKDVAAKEDGGEGLSGEKDEDRRKSCSDIPKGVVAKKHREAFEDQMFVVANLTDIFHDELTYVRELEAETQDLKAERAEIQERKKQRDHDLHQLKLRVDQLFYNLETLSEQIRSAREEAADESPAIPEGAAEEEEGAETESKDERTEPEADIGDGGEKATGKLNLLEEHRGGKLLEGE